MRLDAGVSSAFCQHLEQQHCERFGNHMLGPAWDELVLRRGCVLFRWVEKPFAAASAFVLEFWPKSSNQALVDCRLLFAGVWMMQVTRHMLWP